MSISPLFNFGRPKSKMAGFDNVLNSQVIRPRGSFAASGGDDVKVARAATTANIALSGLLTIDGVTLVAGDKVLVKDQSVSSQNGYYTVASGSWAKVSQPEAVVIKEGSTNARLVYILVSANTYSANYGVYA